MGERCEWDPARDEAADFESGCPHEAVYGVGPRGRGLHLCPSCLELPRFRRVRGRARLLHVPSPEAGGER